MPDHEHHDHDPLRELLKDPKTLHVAILLLHQRQQQLTTEIRTLRDRQEALARDMQLVDQQMRDDIATWNAEHRIVVEKHAQTRQIVDLVEARVFEQQASGDWAASLVDWAVKRWWIVLPVLVVLVVVLAKTGILEKLIRLFL